MEKKMNIWGYLNRGTWASEKDRDVSWFETLVGPKKENKNLLKFI